MPIHTSVYFAEDVTGSASAPSYVQLPAATDDAMGLRSNNLVPGENLGLVALAATGVGLGAARIRTPRTVISPAYARPVNSTELFGSDPNVACFSGHPVQVMKGEEIQASAWVNTATSEAAVVVAWFRGQHEPLPAGESFWVTFSATIRDTTEAGWYTAQNFTFVEQPTLPAGRYAIVGMHLMQAIAPTAEPAPPVQVRLRAPRHPPARVPPRRARASGAQLHHALPPVRRRARRLGDLRRKAPSHPRTLRGRCWREPRRGWNYQRLPPHHPDRLVKGASPCTTASSNG